MAAYINETISGKFNDRDLNELYSQVDSTDQKLIDFTGRCQNGPVGSYLKYIGTSSTVRDLVSLGDAIVGSGKPIDYWGVSYGTVVGFNFVNSKPLQSFNRQSYHSLKSVSSVSRGMLNPPDTPNTILIVCSAPGMWSWTV